MGTVTAARADLAPRLWTLPPPQASPADMSVVSGRFERHMDTRLDLARLSSRRHDKNEACIVKLACAARRWQGSLIEG